MKPLMPYDLRSLNFPEKKYPWQIFPSSDEYNLRKDQGRTGNATIIHIIIFYNCFRLFLRHYN